ncbi:MULTISPECIES: SdpA family antimicrobial peptide system protein [Streptomyces]|uniref:SdpA family antimicrobial peptide system protein n=1 Tax=Streptomyces TaxID=1883 RepID=UPI000CD51EDA|nr:MULTISPECIES: SdpA family antimicrobial peptide system protein [Streptomyces]
MPNTSPARRRVERVAARLPVDRVDVSAARTVAVPRSWIAGLAALAVLLTAYVAQAQLPSNVVTLPAQDTVARPAAALFPQGWAFFTKSARDPEFEPLRFTDGQWRSAALGRHSEYGFNRASRSQGIEIAVLLHAAAPFDYTECEQPTATACADAAPLAAEVDNPVPDPTLCGRVAVATQHPVPWAWRDLMDTPRTAEELVVLEVSC